VIMVRFAKSGLRRVVWSRASVSTSTAAVASSSTRMLDGVRRARARETSWRCPCERLDPLCVMLACVMFSETLSSGEKIRRSAENSGIDLKGVRIPVVRFGGND
jgi:hypothetical protein